MKSAPARMRGPLTVFISLVSLAICAVLAGCVTYSQSQLAAMSSVDLCELQAVQNINLTDDTQRALQGELQRRNDNCRNHAAAVEERRQAFMYRQTYGKIDAP